MSEELKPCPFCLDSHVFDTGQWIACEGCGFKNTIGSFMSLTARKADHWNQRPIEDALQAQIEQRDQRIKELEQALYEERQRRRELERSRPGVI